jgi:hypothetical protein
MQAAMLHSLPQHEKVLLDAGLISQGERWQ